MKLGSAFSDSLILEKKKVNRLDTIGRPAWWMGSGRTLLFASLLLVAFFILVARLVDLTIIKGHQYRILADENRIRELVRHAPRGLLLDRTGRPLVANTPSFRLVRPCGATSTLCAERISREQGEQLLKDGLPVDEFLEIDFRREYLFGDVVAHVLGYTGELSQDELSDDYYSLRKYRPGDRIGRDGVEAVFEERLRGRDGKELIEVDSKGGFLRTLGIDPDAPGTTITLSLDWGLGDAVAKAFPKGERGAVVVSRPQTGEILALFSSPSYNPNLFSAGLSDQSFSLLFDNPSLPLFNRAIGGVYPPGSTYKLVTSLAALQEKAITPDTIIEDVGVLKIGESFSFPNWYFLKYGRTDGNIGLGKAIARSNDIYFYKTGEFLGITKLALWSRKFGIGKPLGIELAGEASGNMPDPDWKAQRFNTPSDITSGHNQWYLGDTYHIAIGQGYLLATPLHVNFWTAVVANGGKLCRPTVEKVLNVEKTQRDCTHLGFESAYIDIVTGGMRDACSPGGTGVPLFNFTVPRHSADDASVASPSGEMSHTGVSLACKTGTAEYGDPKGNTHAWFTAFAPIPKKFVKDIPEKDMITGDPEIVVTVLIEGAGEGSEKAAPVAKEIFSYWFSR